MIFFIDGESLSAFQCSLLIQASISVGTKVKSIL